MSKVLMIDGRAIGFSEQISVFKNGEKIGTCSTHLEALGILVLDALTNHDIQYELYSNLVEGKELEKATLSK